ncbi:MAG: hypothetical protein D6734_09165 [Candidatus Schekmanbacteria bacterium]|nr:MAG: hypothetical protein D6734_09165 [Candidatus Schekmanbacteria bacterium]
MKFKKALLAIGISFALCFAMNIDAAQKSYRYKKKKPFQGKFVGKITQDSITYKVYYKIKQDGTSLSGQIKTKLNGQTVLPLTFTGKVDNSGKMATITLLGEGGMDPTEIPNSGIPSDNVRVYLRRKGRIGLKMYYVNDSGQKMAKTVKYKRIK